MSTTTTTKTLAFFGATGGCACYALAAALRDGYTCTALARTPEKLRNQLLDVPYSIPAATIDSQLTIIRGNVKSVSDVQRTLLSPKNPSVLVGTIIFGVGGAPKWQWSLLKPLTLDDPRICETGVSTVLAALEAHADSGIRASSGGEKPLIIGISSFGVGEVGRDVPWALYLPYHWLLRIPHADKRKMEKVLFGAAKSGAVKDFCIVRPTFFGDGVGRGLEKVRVGWEWGVRDVKGREKEAGTVLGYWIKRADVGEWIFREGVVMGGWEGKCVNLTY